MQLSQYRRLGAQVVSSLLAGAAAGSLAGSGLADSLGRKTALLLDAVPLLVGALISATASSLTAMVTGRIICGLGIGLASALVPLYISEVSSRPYVQTWDAPKADTDRSAAVMHASWCSWTLLG